MSTCVRGLGPISANSLYGTCWPNVDQSRPPAHCCSSRTANFAALAGIVCGRPLPRGPGRSIREREILLLVTLSVAKFSRRANLCPQMLLTPVYRPMASPSGMRTVKADENRLTTLWVVFILLHLWKRQRHWLRLPRWRKTLGSAFTGFWSNTLPRDCPPDKSPSASISHPQLCLSI